jgi:S-formylglutathione hydrolase FrmB
MIYLKLLLLLTFISCTSQTVRRPASPGMIVQDFKTYWIVKPEGEFFVPIPVVYFLHGRGGNRHMFRDLGGVEALKTHLDNGGTPFAVVGLTGTFDGKDSYWTNDTRDEILKTIIPQIEADHSIGGNNNRMISGISMGSHGSFQMALTTKHFKCVAGHSLVLRNYQSMNAQFPGLFGTKRQFAKRDPIQLIKKIKSPKKLTFKKAWIDIGGKDSPEFIDRAKLMEAELMRLKFPAESFDISKSYPNGSHDLPYWKARLPEYLAWYGQCFL